MAVGEAPQGEERGLTSGPGSHKAGSGRQSSARLTKPALTAGGPVPAPIARQPEWAVFLVVVALSPWGPVGERVVPHAGPGEGKTQGVSGKGTAAGWAPVSGGLRTCFASGRVLFCNSGLNPEPRSQTFCGGRRAG